MDVVAPQVHRGGGERPDPSLRIERIGIAAPDKVPLDVIAEGGREVRPSHSCRYLRARRKRNWLQPLPAPKPDQDLPGLRDTAVLLGNVARQARGSELGNEALNHRRLDLAGNDPPQARPAREP